MQSAKDLNLEPQSLALEAMKASLLFRDIPHDMQIELLNLFEARTYSEGEPVFLEQEKSDSFYIIVQGQVEIVKYAANTGRLQRIVSLGSGESFSELSLLAQSNHSTSAFSIKETSLLIISRDTFFQLLQRFKRMGFTLVYNLALLNRQVLQEKDHIDSYREGLLQPHSQLTKALPFAFIELYQVLPLRLQNNQLLVALRDPNNFAFFKAFRQHSPHLSLKLCLINERDFRQLKKTVASLYTGKSMTLQFQANTEAQPKHANTYDPLTILSEAGPFQALDQSIVQQVLSVAKRLVLSPGQVLFEAGQASELLYVIVDGEIELRASAQQNGSRFISCCEAGEILGEISLILGSIHTLGARATRDSNLLTISKESFYKLLEIPSFSMSVAQNMAKRLQRSNYLARHRQDIKINFKGLHALGTLFPHHLIRQYSIVPLDLVDQVLTLGIVEGAGEGDNIFPVLHRYVSHFRVELVAISHHMFQDCLKAMVEPSQGFTGAPPSITHQPPSGHRPPDSSAFDIVQEVEHVIQLAARMRASDIHLEMQKDGMVFRLRIDGQLQEALEKVSIEIGRQIINRLKILAKLDIAENRLPQDGQISMAERPGQPPLAMRISLVPTMFGEKAVLRLHRSEMSIVPLDLLTPHRQTIIKLRDIVETGEGICLIAGPTGSGKTSTLYAMLTTLNRVETHIISVEDPVEAIIPGITQIPVNAEIGRSFDKVLRHILRQDPDIIMIGEIRDQASAKIAFEAAITGHLVLATVHATDSINCLPRLNELGLDQASLASGLSAVISQRLLRSICNECRSMRAPSPKESKYLLRSVPKNQVPTQLAFGQGCENCHFTGYYDRIAVFELWQKTPRLQQMFFTGQAIDKIIEELRAEGFQSLWESGIQLALSGLTTIDEVVRNCPKPMF